MTSHSGNEDARYGARTLVLNPVFKSGRGQRDPDAALAESIGLAQAINLIVVHAVNINVASPAPATLFGKGQVENAGTLIAEKNIELAIVDHPLSPVQQRNLEKDWKCKVIDRTGLILEIFGERARTREGMLQVELAALDYQKSRLVRSWTHLERQRGGFGFLGGPGESQLEIDRRLITSRITKLKDELDDVRRTRGLQREARQRAEHPTIALVGYTNAGKSSLFNRLTGAEVLAKDMLFATLDPTMRGMKLPGGREAILSDTVGFISDLPTHLIEAFRATLEEVQLADVILHVRDVSHPETRTQREAVIHILADLGIETTDDRLIEVLNKVDLLPEDERKHMAAHAERITEEVNLLTSKDSGVPLPLREGLGEGYIKQKTSYTPHPTSPARGEEFHRSRGDDWTLHSQAAGGMIAVSALTGEGMPNLLHLLEDKLAARSHVFDIDVALADGAALAWLHAHGKIINQHDTKTKAHLKVELSPADYGRFQSRFNKV